MSGANLPLELVRLESAGDTFAILGRFPAGFERPIPGGYACAEEFLVLDGGLELEGMRLARGALCFIPAHHVRAPMRAPRGCTVLAWFSGPAIFRPAEDLDSAPAADIAMAAVQAAPTGTRLLHTTESDWDIIDAERLAAWTLPVDLVDLALTTWARVGPEAPRDLPPGMLLARVPLTGDRR